MGEVHYRASTKFYGYARNMRTLARYILKEFLPPFIIALICFTLMLIFHDLFRLTKLFVQKGVNPLYLVELLIYVMPATIVLSLPMALLVAILLALGRFSTDNEIVAMKAHGIAFHQLMLPLLAVSVLVSVIDLVLIDYALPQANVAYASLQRDIRRHKPAFVLEEATVMKELENEGKLWMYESTDPKNGRMQNVKIWDNIWSGRPRFSHAQEASLGFEDGRAMLTLYDGLTYEPTPANLDEFRVTKFQQQRLALQLTEDIQRGTLHNQNPRSMRILQLKKLIGTLRTTVQNSKNPDYTLRKIRSAEVEYHKKFSIPFACFVFGIIGIPLGLLVKHGGRMLGFGIGLAVIVIYYLLLQLGQNAGINGTLPPAMAMWLPNIVIGLFGIALNVWMIAEGKIRAWLEHDSLLPLVVSRKVES